MSQFVFFLIGVAVGYFVATLMVIASRNDRD